MPPPLASGSVGRQAPEEGTTRQQDRSLGPRAGHGCHGHGPTVDPGARVGSDTPRSMGPTRDRNNGSGKLWNERGALGSLNTIARGRRCLPGGDVQANGTGTSARGLAAAVHSYRGAWNE